MHMQYYVSLRSGTQDDPNHEITYKYPPNPISSNLTMSMKGY